jgi:hypothetical protein
MSEFIISKSEINRRITAFTHLLIFLFVGLFLTTLITSYTFIAEHLLLFIISMVSYVFIAVLSRYLTIRFFISFLHTTIDITNTYIERKTTKSKEKFNIADIRKLHIQWTSRHIIREIQIFFTSSRYQFLDGLDHFEQCKKILVDVCHNTIEVTESHEPLDYDHPLFYPILGLALGSISIGSILFLSHLSQTGMTIIHMVLAMYICILGVYFIVRKPLTKRYGYPSEKTDNIFGIGLILAAIAIGVWSIVIQSGR